MKVDVIKEDDLKAEKAKEEWRKFSLEKALERAETVKERTGNELREEGEVLDLVVPTVSLAERRQLRLGPAFFPWVSRSQSTSVGRPSWPKVRSAVFAGSTVKNWIIS